MMLLITSIAFSEEYKIIRRSEDGRYYLDEETLVMLANYIARLEELNENYKLQISNLEQQVIKLKELLELERAEKNSLTEELNRVKTELEKLKKANTVWTVVAAIAIGATIVLFVK